MEKETYILIYNKYIAGTGEILRYSTLGVYSLSREEMENLDFRITTAILEKELNSSNEVFEDILFKKVEITSYEQAENVIKMALKEQNTELEF